MSVVISVYYNLSCPPLVGQQIHPFLSEAVLSAFGDLAQLPSVLSSPHQATLVFAVLMLSFLVNLLLSPSWSVSLLKRYCTSGGLNNSLQTLFHMICRLHSWLYRMICPFFFFFFFPHTEMLWYCQFMFSSWSFLTEQLPNFVLYLYSWLVLPELCIVCRFGGCPP